MRQTLWNSLDEWSSSVQKWYRQPFNTLDVDELTERNGIILKNCTMLEKNLPPNKIVPKLRNDAETFKGKLPVLGYLRNNALRAVRIHARHFLI